MYVTGHFEFDLTCKLYPQHWTRAFYALFLGFCVVPLVYLDCDGVGGASTWKVRVYQTFLRVELPNIMRCHELRFWQYV
jgi:hypothetical protein